jgi:hypothetical protein
VVHQCALKGRISQERRGEEGGKCCSYRAQWNTCLPLHSKLKEGEIEMPKNPLSDPNQMEAMMEQAKKSMVMMIPQTVIMGWINYFFTGFVLSECG